MAMPLETRPSCARLGQPGAAVPTQAASNLGSILLGSIGFPVVAVKSQLEKSHHPLPSPIASHSQLEEITWGMPFNGIA